MLDPDDVGFSIMVDCHVPPSIRRRLMLREMFTRLQNIKDAFYFVMRCDYEECHIDQSFVERLQSYLQQYMRLWEYGI